MVRRTVMIMMVKARRRARAAPEMASRRTTGKDLNQAMLGEHSRLTWATARAETKPQALMEANAGEDESPEDPGCGGEDDGGNGGGDPPPDGGGGSDSGGGAFNGGNGSESGNGK